MPFSRGSHKSGRLIALLIAGLLLRSLIAPGYMLDAHADGDLRLSIEICRGTDTLAGLAGQRDVQEHNPPGRASQDNHVSACDLWSASSPSFLLFFDSSLFPAERFWAALPPHHNLSLPGYSGKTTLARAPPALG